MWMGWVTFSRAICRESISYGQWLGLCRGGVQGREGREVQREQVKEGRKGGNEAKSATEATERRKETRIAAHSHTLHARTRPSFVDPWREPTVRQSRTILSPPFVPFCPSFPSSVFPPQRHTLLATMVTMPRQLPPISAVAVLYLPQP